MTTTIDRAGRVVIPAAIRERQGFSPGTELEILLDDLGIRLTRAVPGPEVVEQEGLRFARPTVPTEKLPKVDLDRLIGEERARSPW